MANAFIFHGYGASPDANWFPWLKKELEARGYNVFVPAFPDSNHPDREKWLKHFEQYKKHVNKDTVFVGHSLGAPFILNILEQLNTPIKAAFLVAGFTGPIGPDFDPYVGSISIRDFNWKKIKQNCKKFVIFASDNDPYVPAEKAEELHKLLPSELIIIKRGEHLNAGSGYFTFNELRDAILKA
ncbi:serine hydrolase family protein [Candidatus Micrarchaeota archaeon]|nr:serine hydrolase family protein [Candidatus Micrarchaeota archaeon]